MAESSEARVKHLEQVFLNGVTKSKGQSLSVETLLDALLVLYDECNSSALLREKNVSEFVDYVRPVTSTVRQKRLHRDDFETLKIIGRGAFGEVAVVKEKSSENVYAMKILNKWEMLKRADTACFKEERDVLVYGDRRWITNLHYAFQDDNFLYLVMDYYCGGDLLTLLSKFEDRLPEDMCKFYVAEMVLAISSLHELRYVHRDIKPDNVLLDRSGHIVLADFGSCLKLMNDGTVRSSVAVGTPDYISPEILRAMEDGHGCYGPECDWWSLGVCMYEMLYGETPFYAESLVETYGRIMDHQTRFEFPAELDDVSEDAQDLIKRLICVPSERFGKNGLDEFKAHVWFSGIDWDNIRDMDPPYKPEVTSATDTSNFDVEDMDFKHTDTVPPTSHSNFKGHHLPFVGFTFTKDCKLSDLSRLYAPDKVTEEQRNIVQSEIFERRIKGLEKENKDLNQRIQESTATISRLQTLENGVGAASAQDEGEAIEMREQIAAMHSVIADSQAEVTTLEQELKRSSEVVLDLERRLRLMEEEKGAFEKELQDWRDKYKSQARELKEALNKQKLAMEQFTDINDQVLKLQSKVKELNREVRNKDEEVEDQRRAIDGLKQDKRKGDKSINELQNLLDEARSESGKERRLRERAEQYAQDLEQEMEGIKRKQMGRGTSGGVVELTQEVSRLKAEIEKNESEHEDSVSRLSSRHASELSEARFQLKESETKRQDLSEEVTRLQAKVTEQLNNEVLVEQVTRLQSQVESSDHRVSTLTEENQRLQEESNSQCNRIDTLVRERTQMEDEIRDIYDKRESVAQWEAQITEIIKWVSDEKDARGYLQALATKMTEELENLKVMGVPGDESRPRWRNRRSQKLDKMELLTLQSQLQSELQAKQQISGELSRTKEELTLAESKLTDSNNKVLELQEKVKHQEEQMLRLNDQQRPNITSNERVGGQSSSSIFDYLNDRYSLMPDQMSTSSEREEDSEADTTSHADSRTDSRSDVRGGSDTTDSSITRDTSHTSHFTQPYEPVYEPPWNKRGSPGLRNKSPQSSGAKDTDSPKSPHSKTHKFIVKSFQSPYRCYYCTSLLVGLQRQGVQCEVCGYTCHIACMDKCPKQCPVPNETKRPHGLDVNKGQGTAYEGFVKIPRLGGIKKGWVRQYMVVCDFKLFLYEIPADKNCPSQIVQQVVDMRDEDFTAAAVLPSDVIHANKKDIPCIFRVTTTEMMPPGSQHQILLLADTEREKEQWLAILTNLHKILRSKHLPNRSVYSAQEVCDNSLTIVKSTHCAAILDSSRVLFGTEDGLYVVDLSKDHLIRVGDRSERKQVYQIAMVTDAGLGLVVFISGKQRHIKLLHQSALDGHDCDPLKINETKGCSVFCHGLLRQQASGITGVSGGVGGVTAALAVAIKRTVQVYEINKTRARYRKMKDIQVPGQVECIEMMSERLCVGYPSCFAIYSVQGDGAPMTLVNTENSSLSFLVQNPITALTAVELSPHEFLLVFSIVGLYVDNHGNRSRAEEILWPAPPVAVTFSSPYLSCYSENSIFVFDVRTAEWVQTLCLKKTRPLNKEGSLSLLNTLDSQHIVYLKDLNADEDKLAVMEMFKQKSSRNKRRFSFKTSQEERASKGTERRNREISGPLTFSHVAHVGPGQKMPDSLNPPPPQPSNERRSKVISSPTNFSHIAHIGPDQVLLDLPKASGSEEMQRVKSMFQPPLKPIQESQMRGARPLSSHFNGSAVNRQDSRPGRGRPSHLPPSAPTRGGDPSSPSHESPSSSFEKELSSQIFEIMSASGSAFNGGSSSWSLPGFDKSDS